MDTVLRKKFAKSLEKRLTKNKELCIIYLARWKAGQHARVAQLVERDLAKVEAAGSSPVSRSYFLHEKDIP